MRITGGVEETIGAEAGIAGGAYIAHIAAIGPEAAACGIPFFKCLIGEVPDEATLQLPVLIDQVPVSLQVTTAIAHHMRILTEDIRPAPPFFHIFLQCMHAVGTWA